MSLSSEFTCFVCGMDWCSVHVHESVDLHVWYMCVHACARVCVCHSKRTSADSPSSKDSFLRVTISCCEAEGEEGDRTFSYSLPDEVSHLQHKIAVILKIFLFQFLQ